MNMLVKGSARYHSVKSMTSPAKIAPIDPKVSAMTWRKAPLMFRLSSLDLERVIAASPLAMRPKTAIINIVKLSTGAGCRIR